MGLIDRVQLLLEGVLSRRALRMAQLVIAELGTGQRILDVGCGDLRIGWPRRRPDGRRMDGHRHGRLPWVGGRAVAERTSPVPDLRRRRAARTHSHVLGRTGFLAPAVHWCAAQLRSWNWSPAATVDLRGDLLIVSGSDGDPWGWSPDLALPADRTSVPVVELAVPQGTCARSQLIWRYASGPDHIVHADIEPGQHDYVFVSSAYPPGDTLVGLRFDPLLCAGSAEVLRIEVGGLTSP